MGDSSLPDPLLDGLVTLTPPQGGLRALSERLASRERRRVQLSVALAAAALALVWLSVRPREAELLLIDIPALSVVSTPVAPIPGRESEAAIVEVPSQLPFYRVIPLSQDRSGQ